MKYETNKIPPPLELCGTGPVLEYLTKKDTSEFAMKKPLRMTPQRMIMIEELQKSKAHHTAHSLHKLVGKKLYNVSLATVNRNLVTLSEMGQIKKLEISGHQKYFDPDLEPHDHIFCDRCHRIDHIELEQEIILPQDHDNGYLITGHIFYGVCPECRGK